MRLAVLILFIVVLCCGVKSADARSKSVTSVTPVALPTLVQKEGHSSGGDINAPASAPKVTEVRVLHFPEDKSIGVLRIGTYFPGMDNRGEMVQVAGAKGTVKVTVPPNHYLVFEANKRVFENPIILNQVSEKGIDQLKLGFISLDDREDGMCNRALDYIGHFTDLDTLLLERSEANDAGLANVRTLKKLRAINCFRSDVAGGFFKELIGLPQFTTLDCAWCAIDRPNFKYLAQIPKLTYLNLTRTGLDDASLKEVAKCRRLLSLRIGANPKVTDDCMKDLLPIKTLRWLDLRGGVVTIKGVRVLAPLPLTKLRLSGTLNTPSNMSELHRLFPGAEIMFSATEVPSDIQRIYAPLR